MSLSVWKIEETAGVTAVPAICNGEDAGSIRCPAVPSASATISAYGLTTCIPGSNCRRESPENRRSEPEPASGGGVHAEQLAMRPQVGFAAGLDTGSRDTGSWVRTERQAGGRREAVPPLSCCVESVCRFCEFECEFA